jgi:hypothetical protein
MNTYQVIRPSVPLFFIIYSPVISLGSLTATNAPASVKQEWLSQYDDLNKQITTPLAKQAAIEASIIADKNALILPTDRDALDIVVRRTQALLDNISRMPKAPDLSKLRLRLNDVKSRVAGGGLAKAAFDSLDRKNLFLEVCALRREAVTANPLLNFDSLIFM